MDRETYDRLREAADDEGLSYGEIAEIEAAFALIPDERLRDLRGNATADDMLDEIAAFGSRLPGGFARHTARAGASS